MTDAELLLATEALSGVGGWAFDAATQQLRWTPQAFRLHGLDPAGPQPSLAQALALVMLDDRQRLQDMISAVLARGLPGELELTVLPPGGTPRRLHVLAQPQPGPGAVMGVSGTLRLAAPQTSPSPMSMDPRSYRFALAAAGVGVFEMDLDTGQEVWNERTLELYGLPPGSHAPTRQQWRDHFLHPDDRARAAEFTGGGRPYELDYRIRRANDGAVRWVHTRAAYAYGGTRYVLGVTLDITERKLAEQRAQDAWHALDVSATQVGFGFGWRDANGDVGEWSPQLRLMFGLAADAPTPTRSQVLQLVDEADRERLAQELWLSSPPGQMREIEYRVRRHDGSRRILMSRTVMRHDGDGRPQRYYFAVIDLTETRARDRELAELLERLQMATEASGIGTWERDPQADVATWDDTTLALFGLPPGSTAPTGDAYLALIHPEDRARVGEMLQVTAAEAPNFDCQFRVLLPDGRVRWLLTRGRSHRDASGRVVRRSGICFDITERRQAEAALQAQALAERANAAKTEFLSRMSHELRTPLNAVLGFAQLLMLDAAQPLSEPQRARVAHIQNAGWHLLALINDVLDLTRIESRQAQLQPELLPLAELVDECLAMHAQAAAQRGIRLLPQRDASTPHVAWADRMRFKQVLLNLLSNAIKYNRDGGWVRLSLQALPGNLVQLAVCDSGLGLTAEQLAQLFEPFNRLGRERSAVEGTGIGLALSKLIAEQMGGRLEARSEPGVGSEFLLTLPASP